MLKTRLMPTLLWKDVGLVKGEAFHSWRRVGTVMPAIKVYNRREVDELVLLDITATGEARDPDYGAIAEFSAECSVPLTVGGGIGDLEQIRQLLRAGADKVVINTAAYRRPDLITEASARFGSQCIVAGVDTRRHDDGSVHCYSHCGSRHENADPVEWARHLEVHGAGEILLTSIDRDGTMRGYDIATLKSVSEAVSVPVIASGGAGSYAHIHQALAEGGASAVAAASIFHFTEQTPAEAKRYLAEQGIPVRR